MSFAANIEKALKQVVLRKRIGRLLYKDVFRRFLAAYTPKKNSKIFLQLSKLPEAKIIEEKIRLYLLTNIILSYL